MMKNTMIVMLSMLGLSAPAAAQFRTSFIGAVAALNAPVVAASAPATPLVQSVSPVGLSPAVVGFSLGGGNGVSPLVTVGAGITAPDLTGLLNLKDIGFAYQSSLFWWVAYFQYTSVAQSLIYSPDGSQVQFGSTANGPVYEPVDQGILDAVNFFTSGGNFTMFRDFSSRKINLVLSANLPVPIQQNPDPTNTYVTYSPTRTGAIAYVPLKF